MTDQPSNEAPHPHCPECDYDLTGAPGPRCPWCGWEISLDQLAGPTHPLATVERWGTVATAGLIGMGSLLAVTILGSRGSRLVVYDALAFLSILIAAAGHLVLAVMAVRAKRRWPMHSPEAATVLTGIGWLSLLGGVLAATQALDIPPSRRMVQGVVVSGALDFLVRAFFFTLPGWTLLAIRLGAFRRRREARLGTRSSAQQAEPAAAVDYCPFAVEALGPYSPDQIRLSWSDEVRPTTAAIEEAVSRSWEAHTNRAAAGGRVLFNGPLVRLRASTATHQSLDLALGPTDYRDFLGTNLTNAASAMFVGTGFLSDAIGTSAAVLTQDGYLALGRRNDRVAYHAGCLHPFGGMMEAEGRDPAGKYDVFAAILRELREELGVAAEELAKVLLLGLIRDRSIYQPELVFETALKVSRDNLVARSGRAEFTAEHTQIEFVSDEPEAVAAYLARAEPLTPVAQGTLLLHGRCHWGSDWYEQTCYLLYGELPPLIGRTMQGTYPAPPKLA